MAGTALIGSLAVNLSMETATPGVYYHGSPRVDLTTIESAATAHPDWRMPNHGIFFTDKISFAKGVAGARGRVYKVELLTSNPLWSRTLIGHAWFNRGDVKRLRAAGHDSVIIDLGVYKEIVVFDRRQIVYLEKGMGADATRWPRKNQQVAEGKFGREAEGDIEIFERAIIRALGTAATDPSQV